jgi:hypothetical protein
MKRRNGARWLISRARNQTDWWKRCGHLDPKSTSGRSTSQIADRAEITERTSDYITGHSHKTEGAKYGAPTLEGMAEVLGKFPRYDLSKT